MYKAICAATKEHSGRCLLFIHLFVVPLLFSIRFSVKPLRNDTEIIDDKIKMTKYQTNSMSRIESAIICPYIYVPSPSPSSLFIRHDNTWNK